MDLVEHEGFLHAGPVRLDDLAERLGTPLVLFDADTLIERFYRFVEAFAPLRAMVCFAADACPNAHVMRRLVKRGAALRVRTALDLERAWFCGAPLSRAVYSALGKSDMDIRAALDGLYSPLFQAGRLVEGKPPYYRGPVGYFSVESAAELEQITRIAGGVRIACRALVHVRFECCRDRAFGAHPDEVVDIFDRFASDPRVRLAGLRVHIGAAGSSPENMVHATTLLSDLASRLCAHGRTIDALDIGGGFACDLFDPHAPSPEDYARTLAPVLLPWVERGTKIIAEPGWSIIAAGSLLVSRVLTRRACESGVIAACDAIPGEPGGADEAPARLVTETNRSERAAPTSVYAVEMPGRCVRIRLPLRAGDLLAWPGGGAYARRDNPGACEVLTEKGRVFVIRPRSSAIDALEPELESHEVLL